MWIRWGFITGLLVLGMGLQVFGQQLHRNGFAGRETSWLRGEDNVRATISLHEVTEQYSHNGPSSEQIRLENPLAPTEPGRIEYYYPTPQAPVSSELHASVWVKATRTGIRLQARLVLPRERDPRNPTQPLTTLLDGSRYQLLNKWQRLELTRPVRLLQEEKQQLRVKLGYAVDMTDAYIDQLILNLYVGPGMMDIFIDDLEIGPVPEQQKPDGSPQWAQPTQQKRTLQPREARPIPVQLRGNRLFVGGKPFFMRAIRHTNTPLKSLADAGFNTVWFGPQKSTQQIEEAIQHGFWIVPSLPLLDGRQGGMANRDSSGRLRLVAQANPRRDPLINALTPEALTNAIQRFRAGDGVLFWDLGAGRIREELPAVARTAEAIRVADPDRPRSVDLWDGFQDYSAHVDMIGSHRWPLFSSLELNSYQQWLDQRRYLTAPGMYRWTWIQTHLPTPQARLFQTQARQPIDPSTIGPQPEQIRLLTYLALASGCRGLGFWSDQSLGDSQLGRDRLLTLALLNQEITMLNRILFRLDESPTWISTSNPNVKAAVFRGDRRGVLVIPIYLGSGLQCVPGQAAVRNLSITVPQIPDGAQPWEILPGNVRSLHNRSQRVLGGTTIVLPEFDLTTAIVFTSDLSPEGDVVFWQDYSRRKNRLSAQYAIDIAASQLRKVGQAHQQLVPLAPAVPDAQGLLRDAADRLQDAYRAFASEDHAKAYFAATRALRPLRILMRAHWENAVRYLDVPTASPFALSFFTLPHHWRLAAEIRQQAPGLNVLRGGDFEAGSPGSSVQATDGASGVSISVLPGWVVQQETLDPVVVSGRVISTKNREPRRTPGAPPIETPYSPTSKRSYVNPQDFVPLPKLGERMLVLTMLPQAKKDARGKPIPPPRVLERSYIAISSPEVQLPPGTLVRISGWLLVASKIVGSSDGVLLYDTVGGEGLGVRIGQPEGWKKVHLYRRVPASGRIGITVMLTGIGTVLIDNLRIEPYGYGVGNPSSESMLTPPR